MCNKQRIWYSIYMCREDCSSFFTMSPTAQRGDHAPLPNVLCASSMNSRLSTSLTKANVFLAFFASNK